MYYAPREETHPEQRAFSMLLYVMAAIGAVVQYAESLAMNIVGFAFLTLVGFMVKAQKLTAQGTIYASHVKWIQRTLSIASYILFPICSVIIIYLVFKFTDLETPRRALEAAETKDATVTAGIVKDYLKNNEARINSIFTWSITPPILWWTRRCWYGYSRAKKSEPIDFPDSLI